MIKKSEYLAKYLDIEFKNTESSFEECVDDIINELDKDSGLLKKVVSFIIRFKIIKILLNDSLLIILKRIIKLTTYALNNQNTSE